MGMALTHPDPTIVPQRKALERLTATPSQQKKPRPRWGDRGFSVQPLDGWPCGYHPGSILADAGGYKKPRHIVANADRGS